MIGNSNSNVKLIFQEFIKLSIGTNLRVVKVGGRVIGARKRTANDGNFKVNYSRGGVIEKFDITPEIVWLVLEISR